MQQQIIIRPNGLPAFTGLSKSTIERLRREGDFPQARRLGRQAIGFLKAEIETWLSNRPVVTQ